MRTLLWFSLGAALSCLLVTYGEGWIALAVVGGAAAALSLPMRIWLRPASHDPDPGALPQPRRAVYQLSRMAFAVALGMMAAAPYCAVRLDGVYSAALPLASQQPQAISCTIRTYPRQTDSGSWQVEVELHAPGSPLALLYGGEGWDTVRPGDRAEATATLSLADTLAGEPTAYYLAQGIFLRGSAQDYPDVTRPDTPALRHWPALCAHALSRGISLAFDPVAAPLAAAVTLGDRTGLDEALSAALSRSGLMHAVVVSGMHISYLVSIFLLLSRGRSRLTPLLLLPILLFYGMMVGATPSALRAVLMQGVALAAPWFRREGDARCALAFALLVLLVQNPCAAASVSLQLSFGAVLGLLLFAEPIYQSMARPLRKRFPSTSSRPFALLRRLLFALCASISSSLAASAFTTPLIALYFGQLNLISPLSNLLALWAVSALMAVTLVLAPLALVLPQLAAALGSGAGWIAHYLRAVVCRLGVLPLASVDSTLPLIRIWMAGVYLQLPVLFGEARHRLRRLAALTLSSALLLGVALLLQARLSDTAQLSVTALDVGQGSATLFVSGSAAALVDCGGSGSRSAGDIAADRLIALGHTQLDVLVLTHLDEDHCNGVPQLFRRLDIAQVVLPKGQPNTQALEMVQSLAQAEGAQLRFLADDTLQLPLGQASLTLFPPMGFGEANQSGLFALCSCQDFDVLITGDAGQFVEQMFLKYHTLPDLEVLVVGHHGASSSTHPQFLQRLSPEYALISVGYNTYNHPHPQVLARLEALGAQVLRTDQLGSITLSFRHGLVAQSP